MKLLAVGLAVLLAVAGVAAVDVSGTWNVNGEVVGNVVKLAAALKQSGESLSGTATFDDGRKPVPISGKVKDRTVEFQFDVEYNGSTYTNVFTGTLGENGVIEGSIAVGGVTGTFTAKKP
jgi:hypothetical protein